MVTRTGLESSFFQAVMRSDEASRDPERRSTVLDEPTRSSATGTVEDTRPRSVTAVPAYVEAAGRIAAEALARGDAALAQEILAQAGRVAAALGRTSAGQPIETPQADASELTPSKKE
jgi:hypothetical protein